MKTKKPETLEGLTITELNELGSEAVAEARELAQIPEDQITAEQSADLVLLVGLIGEVDEAAAAIEPEAPSADEVTAARAALAELDAEAGDDGDNGDEDADADADEQADEHVDAQEREPVLASGVKASRKFGSFSTKVGSKNQEPDCPSTEVDQRKSEALSIRAAANIGGFDSGSELKGYDDLAKAYAERSRTFSNGARGAKVGRKSLPANGAYGGTQLSKQAERFAVATLEKPENEFTITEKMSAEDQYDLIMRASKEKRLGNNALVAGGGWCAPTDRIYGFLELEGTDGLLSIPEITTQRSGISYTKGPTLGELLLEANLGWEMTEAQAEAEDVKPVYDIECPDWDEVIMVAVGYALRAGLLTRTAYPELIRRYLGLATVVHARRMNAKTIARVSNLIGAATTFASVSGGGTAYSATADMLSFIELLAIKNREQYSMPENATLEGVFPLWVKSVIRADLSRRGGDKGYLSVTDQEINAWFAQRKIAAQFVRDYQNINGSAVTTLGGTAGWTRWPNRSEFMLYPAGSYVRLAAPVIDLDVVYDTDDLTKNRYMAAFFEEGFEVANTGGSGVKGLINLEGIYGATGYPAIAALANVTPTP